MAVRNCQEHLVHRYEGLPTGVQVMLSRLVILNKNGCIIIREYRLNT